MRHFERAGSVSVRVVAALFACCFAAAASAQNIVPNTVVVEYDRSITLGPGVGSSYGHHAVEFPEFAVFRPYQVTIDQGPVLVPEPYPQRAHYTAVPLDWDPPIEDPFGGGATGGGNPGGPVGPPRNPLPLLASTPIRAQFKLSDVPPGFTNSDMRIYWTFIEDLPAVPNPGDPLPSVSRGWQQVDDLKAEHVLGNIGDSFFWVTTETRLLPDSLAAHPNIITLVEPTMTCTQESMVDVQVTLTDWNIFAKAPQGGFGGYVVQLNGAPLTADAGDPSSFSQTLQLEEGTHELEITATDLSNDVHVVREIVTVDTTPPELVSVTPADGSTITEARPDICLEFDLGDGCPLRIDPNPSTRYMWVDGMEVDATFLNESICFTPTEDLFLGQHVVDVTIRDDALNTLEASWTFTRIEEAGPPRIDSVVPTHLCAAAGGATVTLSGDGFGPDAESNRVYFNSLEGIVVSATETELVAEVPAEADSGLVRVVRVDDPDPPEDSALSNGVELLIDYADSLRRVTGVSVSADGRVFFTDRLMHGLFEASDCTTVQRGCHPSSYGAVMDADPDPHVYLTEGVATGDTGIVSRYRLSDPCTGCCESPFGEASQFVDVACAGLAIDRQDETTDDFVYCTDRILGRLYRIELGDSSGDIYSSGFNVPFDRVAGMAFSPSGVPGQVGDLYVMDGGAGETTNLFRLRPSDPNDRVLIQPMFDMWGMAFDANDELLLAAQHSQDMIWAIELLPPADPTAADTWVFYSEPPTDPGLIEAPVSVAVGTDERGEYVVVAMEDRITQLPRYRVDGIEFLDDSPPPGQVADRLYCDAAGCRFHPGNPNDQDPAFYNSLTVRAEIVPAKPGMTVYWRSADVDDASTDSPVLDPLGDAGDDNRGDVSPDSGLPIYPDPFALLSGPDGDDGYLMGEEANGGDHATSVSYIDPVTGKAHADMTFFTTMQPGDNFQVRAALSLDELDEPLLRGESPVLTIWRWLWVEVDSMAAPLQSQADWDWNGDFKEDLTSTRLVRCAGCDAFPPGGLAGALLKADTTRPAGEAEYPVAFPDPANTSDELEIQPGFGDMIADGVTTGTPYFVRDDPQPQAGIVLPPGGAEGAVIAAMTEAYAPAFIEPQLYTTGSSLGSLLFVRNLASGQDILDITLGERGAQPTEQFWYVHVYGGYEASSSESNDPWHPNGGRLGQVPLPNEEPPDDGENSTGVLFLETQRDLMEDWPQPLANCTESTDPSVREAVRQAQELINTVHESAHQFSWSPLVGWQDCDVVGANEENCCVSGGHPRDVFNSTWSCDQDLRFNDCNRDRLRRVPRPGFVP